jgi:hypothetical protein
MYKVQNTMPGNLPIDLEQGSIILASGQMFDLDEHCSRKWIRSNALLKRLLASSALRLVHDSEVVIASAPIKKVVAVTAKQAPSTELPAPVPAKKVKKAKKPKTIDLSKKAEPTEKEYKKPKATTRKKKEEKDPVEKSSEEQDPVEKSLKEKSSKKSYSYKKDKDDEETEDKPKKRTYTRRKKEEEDD